MRTVVELAPSRRALVQHLRALRPDDPGVEGVTVGHYIHDDRTGWRTHIVSLKGYGVCGFTDAPVNED